jgi:anti-sigma factor RsiW
MDCDEVTPLLPVLADGTPPFWWRVRMHLRGCHGCSAKLEEMRAMRSVLRDKLTYHQAPPTLAARIGAAIAAEAAPPAPVRRPRRVFLPLGGLSLAGSGFAGALAGVALMLLVQAPGPQNSALLGSVIDSHVRSLMADHLTDVLTSDQHTVKPWLSKHIDVSPPVEELADKGFPLVGGRMDYIDGHPAAVVVYRRAKHIINLFAWASDSPNAPMHAETRQGFNVITWRKNGIGYAAVSDVEPGQLAAFAHDVAANG